VIGIVSHILSESGGFQGIGFVISSNVATKLFIEEKAFWSGFESIYLVDEMAQTFNLPQNGGLLVQRVVINSPAFDMGLKGSNIIATINNQEMLIGGDIILEVNNISLADNLAASKIRENLIALNKGDEVTLKVLRAGKIIELKSTRFITQ
jgi:S1-C subfamily serine protease